MISSAHKTIGFAALLGMSAVLAAAPDPAFAQSSDDAQSCGEIIMDVHFDTVEYLDLGEEGPTLHDQRNGRHALLDEAGNRVGYLYFYSVVVTSEEENGISFYKSADFRFEDGSIYATGVYGHSEPTADAIPAESYALAVIGGTGRYRGARGELITEPMPNSVLRHSFNIECLGPAG